MFFHVGRQHKVDQHNMVGRSIFRTISIAIELRQLSNIPNVQSLRIFLYKYVIKLLAFDTISTQFRCMVYTCAGKSTSVYFTLGSLPNILNNKYVFLPNVFFILVQPRLKFYIFFTIYCIRIEYKNHLNITVFLSY